MTRTEGVEFTQKQISTSAWDSLLRLAGEELGVPSPNQYARMRKRIIRTSPATTKAKHPAEKM
jgi:hypothetical protein